MRESEVERPVCKWGEEHGITMQKQCGPNDRGKTDRICLYQGVAAFLEFKRPGEEPTKLQWKYILDRRADGFEADWCDSVAGGIKFLKRVFKV